MTPTDQPRCAASKHAALDPTNKNPVKLFADGASAPIPVTYESMIPAAIKNAFHNWQTEVMNQGVHVHSKVVVIDPFGKNPVVITGSHNLGYKASTKNDDNMVIVEGNAPLAAVRGPDRAHAVKRGGERDHRPRRQRHAKIAADGRHVPDFE